MTLQKTKLSDKEKLIRSLKNKCEFARANYERAKVALEQATKKLNEAVSAK